MNAATLRRKKIVRQEEGEEAPKGSLAALSMGAIGIVFGDIGTSPLYAFQAVLGSSAHPNKLAILGSVSLIIWTLLFVAAFKYVTIAMQFSDKGEGGILALLGLLESKRKQSTFAICIALFGAALVFGDGAITPVISVLSALEGMEQLSPDLAKFVVPIALVILLGLFSIQPKGTAKIGKAFGPIMLLWFASLGLMGIGGIVRYPEVLAAINPYYGINFLIHDGVAGFIMLGSLFLCVTGAEALYADMGHFGPKPIRIGFFLLVLPSLVLNYAGQAALVLSGATGSGSIFYRLCPPHLLAPLIILATLATIIASQAIITGAFSMTRQAINLGWLPRLTLRQTSPTGYGQIYIGAVNWSMMIVTLVLTVIFKKSDNLAAAYGIAVSQTMFFTSILLYLAMRQVWGWSALRAGLLVGAFCIVDLTFFSANVTKILAGGYIPILIAAIIFAAMWLWHRGATAAQDFYVKIDEPGEVLLEELVGPNVARTPGVGVFFMNNENSAPKTLVWQLKYQHSAPEKIVVFHLTFLKKPYVEDDQRLDFEEISPNIWRCNLIYGFMEMPEIEKALREMIAHGCDFDLDKALYYVGHETIMRRKDGKGLSSLKYKAFVAMERNTFHFSEILGLPYDKIIEVRRQIPV